MRCERLGQSRSASEDAALLARYVTQKDCSPASATAINRRATKRHPLKGVYKNRLESVLFNSGAIYRGVDVGEQNGRIT